MKNQKTKAEETATLLRAIPQVGDTVWWWRRDSSYGDKGHVVSEDDVFFHVDWDDGDKRTYVKDVHECVKTFPPPEKMSCQPKTKAEETAALLQTTLVVGQEVWWGKDDDYYGDKGVVIEVTECQVVVRWYGELRSYTSWNRYLKTQPPPRGRRP